MRKIIWLLFILILVTSVSYGQNEEKADTNNEANTASAPISSLASSRKIVPPRFVSGEVLSIDSSNPEVAVLTIKDANGEEMQIEVSPNLSITKIISPVELTLGDNIRITYEEKDNKKTARNIFLGRPHPIKTESAPQ